MKILIIGANGQLGSDLCRQISPTSLAALTHSDIEITSMKSVRCVCEEHKPDIIINTAAFVRVDDCETEIDECFRINALGSRNVAVVAQELQAKLVYISSDYVYGGSVESRTVPFTEFDIPIPINTLGRSKVAGERFARSFCNRHFIIRTSGLFGIAGSSGKGGNFVETIIKLAHEQDELRIVKDQVFSPTYSCDLARKIIEIASTECYGIYHITNKGMCSWWEFARKILDLAGLPTTAIPITSEQFPQVAKRPSYSVLDNYHLRLMGIDDMRHWEEALEDYLQEKGHI